MGPDLGVGSALNLAASALGVPRKRCPTAGSTLTMTGNPKKGLSTGLDCDPMAAFEALVGVHAGGARAVTAGAMQSTPDRGQKSASKPGPPGLGASHASPPQTPVQRRLIMAAGVFELGSHVQRHAATHGQRVGLGRSKGSSSREGSPIGDPLEKAFVKGRSIMA